MSQEQKEITPQDISEAAARLKSTPLGEALVNYINPTSHDEAAANRRKFATALWNALILEDNRASGITAIESLLMAFDAKLAAVQHRVDEAWKKTVSIGGKL